MIMGKRRDIAGFERSAADAARALLDAASVSVVSHIDADGITAAAIASAALSRSGVEHTIRFVKKLDDAEIERINAESQERVWLVDLGSGSFSKLDRSRVVVSDHHRPDTSPPQGMVDLFSFDSHHVNPHLFGLDGAIEISGAGATYVVAKAMDPTNIDLAALAVIGAVGDFQDNAEGRLAGYNRRILKDAVASGRVNACTDLRLFGRETKPLHIFLQFSSDPALLPVLRETQEASFYRADNALDVDRQLCVDFLSDLGVELKDGERWRSWGCLGKEEKKRVASELCIRMLDCGRGLTAIRRLIGEVYVLDPRLVDAPEGWMAEGGGVDIADDEVSWHPNARALLDAKETATLLNACGRHDRAEVGMAICLGDRGESLATALQEQDNHRIALRTAIRLVQEDPSFSVREDAELPSLRYFHGQDQIGDTIVGIVAGMLLGSPGVPDDRPLFAFAQAIEDGATVKVSARGTRDLVRRGLDLAVVMKIASEAVGGTGGGHNAAAGASLPLGSEMEFLHQADEILRRQLSL